MPVCPARADGFFRPHPPYEKVGKNMDDAKKARLSEFTRLAKTRELTEEEQQERQALREEYLAEWRRSVQGVLDNTYIDHGNGDIRKLSKK